MNLQRNNFDVLIDSDAFIARFITEDLLHAEAVKGFNTLKTERLLLATTSAVVAETITVLSHRGGHQLANQFYSQIKRAVLPIVFINEDFCEQAMTMFFEQDKKGVSFVDCANSAVAKRLQIAHIFSYDRFYERAGLKLFK